MFKNGLYETEILMIPGPSEVHPRVTRALMRAAVPHYHREFFEVFDTTREKLKRVFQTDNEVIIMPGSGRVGLEAAILSIVEDGDKVLVIENGIFSEWLSIITRKIGGNSIPVVSESFKRIDLHRVEKKLSENNFKLVAVVHSESSTGAINPIREIGELCRKNNVLYMVDTVSSLGGIDVQVDKWGIDLCCTSSQKCFGAPLGLCMVSVSKNAWERMRKRRKEARSFAFDLYKWKTQWIDKEEYPKEYPVLPSTNLIYALKEATEMIIEEGLEQRFFRHKLAARALREGLRAMGLSLCVDDEIASKTITSVRTPLGLNNLQLRETIREKFGIYISGPVFQGGGDIIRIGHMGTVAYPRFIYSTIIAIEKALEQQDFKIHNSGLQVAEKVYTETT